MRKALNIAVACGGTGGHIFPGLATAHVLINRGHDVSLWLAGKNVEQTAVKDWQGRIVTISSEGFQFGPFRSVLTVLRIADAVFRCVRIMRRHRPNVVLAMGSYASIGPCFAARLLGIPYILHEANAVPGKAVRLLAKKAFAVAICFEETRYYLKNLHAVPIGMPLRSEFKPFKSRTQLEGLHLLIMGGSAGAEAINELVSKAICSLKNPSIYITHLTGSADEKRVADRYCSASIAANVYGFSRNMATLYENATFAICRSGASTCAELGLFSVPALLIPYPTATNDHQTANARVLEKNGSADLVQQRDVSINWLKDYLTTQLSNPERINKMRERATARNIKPDAAEKLAKLVEQCAQK